MRQIICPAWGPNRDPPARSPVRAGRRFHRPTPSVDFVLSDRWLALGVGFGRPNFAAVSSYHIVGSRQVLLLDVPLGGGFVLPFRRFSLGVAFGRYPN